MFPACNRDTFSIGHWRISILFTSELTTATAFFVAHHLKLIQTRSRTLLHTCIFTACPPKASHFIWIRVVLFFYWPLIPPVVWDLYPGSFPPSPVWLQSCLEDSCTYWSSQDCSRSRTDSQTLSPRSSSASHALSKRIIESAASEFRSVFAFTLTQ